MAEQIQNKEINGPAGLQNVDRIITTSSSAPGDIYSLAIKSPIPPPGINRALVSISIEGRPEPLTFEYIYENVCAPPTPPEEVEEIFEEEEDSIRAYESCVDQQKIDDLFCTPREFREIGQLEVVRYSIQTEGKTINEGRIIYPGSIISPILILKGSGYYNLSVVGINKDSNEEVLFIDSKGIETLDVEYILEPEVSVTSLYEKIEVRVQLNDTDGIVTFTDLDVFEIYKQTVTPPQEQEVRRILLLDADLTDSNKETYFSNEIVADVNLSADVAQTNLERTVKDLYRINNGNYWIRQDRQSDNLILMNSETRLDSSILDSFLETKQIDGNYEPFSYKDIVYVQERPFLPKELEFDRVALCTSLVLDVKKEYNYYYREYENVLSSLEQKNLEPLLPNMYYILYSDKVLFEREQDTLKNSRIVNSGRMGLKARNNAEQPSSQEATPGFISSYNNRRQTPYSYPTLDRDIVSCLLLEDKNTEYKINSGELAGKDWYRHFILNKDKIDYTLGSTTANARLFQRAKNIVVPYSGIADLEKFSKQNQLFPMMIDIKFSTERKRDFYSILTKFDVAEKFFLNSVNKFINNDPIEIKRISLVKQQMDGTNARLYRKTNKYIDVTDLQNVISSGSFDNFVYLGDYVKYTEISSSRETDVGTAYSHNFQREIENIIKYRGRDYSSILSGDKCYKETIFYKIEKRSKSSNTEVADIENNAIIQNIYIANDKSRDMIRYIDTQVMYDKNYLYTIYSYDLVVANEITTTTPPLVDDVFTPATREESAQSIRSGQLRAASMEDLERTEQRRQQSPSTESTVQAQSDAVRKLAQRLEGQEQQTRGVYVGAAATGRARGVRSI